MENTEATAAATTTTTTTNSNTSDNSETTKTIHESSVELKSTKETVKKNSATTKAEKRASKSASHAIPSHRPARIFSVEEIIAEASALPVEQNTTHPLSTSASPSNNNHDSNRDHIADRNTSTNKIDPLSPNKVVPPVQERIKRKPVRTAASIAKPSSSRKAATLGEQISVDPLGALSEDSSSITSSVMGKSPSIRSTRSTKSATSTQGKRLTADQLAQLTDLDNNTTGSVKNKVKSESKTTSVITKSTTTITAVKSAPLPSSSSSTPTASRKESKISQPPVVLAQEAVDPLNTTQISRKVTKPKMDPKLAKVIKRTPKYRSTEAIMKEMARWEKNEQGVSSEEEEDNAPLGYTAMGIDTRHIDPSRIGRPLEGAEDSGSSEIAASEWSDDIHRGIKMVGPPLPPTDLAPEVSAGEWANHTPEPEVSTSHLPTMDIPDFAADVLGWSAADEEEGNKEEEEEEEETHVNHHHHHHHHYTSDIVSHTPEDEYVFASKASTASLHSVTSISTTISPTVETFSSIHNSQDGFSILNTVGDNTAPWSPADLDRPSMFSANVEEEEHGDNDETNAQLTTTTSTTTTTTTTSYHVANNMEDEWNPWS
ncbi:hypothetical protein BDF22DRAFT_973 [Syncephalis plumigaleata]|nr:hypothetical protein BDF22DRAFT_973 [Syncephalis plumigaleata]